MIRTVWTLYTLLQVQRQLGAIGVGLFAVAVAAIAGFGGLSLTSLSMISMLTLGIFVLFPTVLAAGYTFRILSAPRAARLLPRFRLRMLAVLCLLVVSLALIGGLCMIGTVGSGQPTQPTFGSSLLETIEIAFVIPFSVISLIVLVTFWVAGSLNRALLILAVVIAGSFLMSEPSASGSVAVTETPLEIAAAAAWTVFGWWYLSGRRVAPSDPSFVFGRPAPQARKRAPQDHAMPQARSRAPELPATPQAAWAAWLIGDTAVSMKGHRLALIIGALFVAGLIAAIVGALLNEAGTETIVFILLLPGVLSSSMFLFARRIGARARYLWLRVPRTRSGLLRLTERLVIARVAGPSLLFAVAVVAVPLLVTGLTVVQALGAAAILLLAWTFAMYAGLAAVRGHMPSWMLSMLLSLSAYSAAIVGLVSDAYSIRVTGWIAVLYVLAIVLVRALAERYWRRADWLVVKPVRIALRA